MMKYVFCSYCVTELGQGARFCKICVKAIYQAGDNIFKEEKDLMSDTMVIPTMKPLGE